MSNCSRCRYAGSTKDALDVTGNVECHRYPPTGRVNTFPLMQAIDWCGEWERSASVPDAANIIPAAKGGEDGWQTIAEIVAAADNWNEKQDEPAFNRLSSAIDNGRAALAQDTDGVART